ncbi:hypothetical protein COCMIDRAFT_91280 [Bipolaris oryzae ATCC 44560]|uniref:Uncharacterized protein n=1 Tax=Bipolaris oryzae ATCC 44560 TaxID=930090 RepID=W6Z5B7_COCMI|nr:uncharacterized protein COCMIDRAFT_91280 [Bipolaris oryzae ATCC 44560]EUC46962.1 hypothetical protein COCMIDRAFT_91280 [Bipolaris oryzae ATCC 44560]
MSSHASIHTTKHKYAQAHPACYPPPTSARQLHAQRRGCSAIVHGRPWWSWNASANANAPETSPGCVGTVHVTH